MYFWPGAESYSSFGLLNYFLWREVNSVVALCTLWLKFACGQVSSPRLCRLKRGFLSSMWESYSHPMIFYIFVNEKRLRLLVWLHFLSLFPNWQISQLADFKKILVKLRIWDLKVAGPQNRYIVTNICFFIIIIRFCVTINLLSKLFFPLTTKTHQTKCNLLIFPNIKKKYSSLAC